MESILKSSLICCILYGFSMYVSADQIVRRRANSFSHVIAVFNNIGFNICETKCSKYSYCKAITFKRKSLYCELLNNTMSSLFVEDEDFIYSEATQFQINNDGCWPNPCSQRQKCIITQSENHICIDLLRNDHLTDGEIKTIIGGRELRIHDVANGKTASQIPDYLPQYDGLYRASWAIDGDKNTFSHTSYFDENTDEEIYWMVDLLSDVIIQRVEIINRSTYGQRFVDVDITIGLTQKQHKLCGHFTGPGSNGQRIVIICHGTLIGKFVKLSMTKPKTGSLLHIAEVEVYAYA